RPSLPALGEASTRASATLPGCLAPGSSAFEAPIALPKGRQLLTLQDAADYIMKLPNTKQDLPEWQTAIEQLIDAAEGRNFLMRATISMLRALNRNVERAFNTDRKETHW